MCVADIAETVDYIVFLLCKCCGHCGNRGFYSVFCCIGVANIVETVDFKVFLKCIQIALMSLLVFDGPLIHAIHVSDY